MQEHDTSTWGKGRGRKPSCLCGECKTCRHREIKRRYASSPKGRATKQAYVEANREKTRQRAEEWRKKNQDRKNAWSRWHREQNADSRLAYDRAYREENRERLSEQRRAKYLEDKRPFLDRARRYKTRKKTAISEEYSLEDVFDKGRILDGPAHCYYCSRELDFDKRGPRAGGWVIDHVIPLSVGGTDTLDNVVPACVSCNCSKQAKKPKEWILGYKHRAEPISSRS